jgi:hypothetical protein
MIRDVIPDLDFLPIQDPGSRGQKGTGSRIRNTDSKGVQKIILLNKANRNSAKLLIPCPS